MSIKAETSFSLKDSLFNERTVAELSQHLADARPGFQRRKFERAVVNEFPNLELKARIDHIVQTLQDFLPDDLPQAINVFHSALPPPLDPSLSDNDFGSFIWVVPGEYVARYGCSAPNLKRSLSFLRESTKRFSAENAIRPFLRDFPETTLEFLKQCSYDDNYHVRRLVSEGIRPLLPWAPRVTLPAATIVPLLDILHADHTRYVTRSVANNLNDLSKQDPDLVIDTLKRWQKLKKQTPAELDWMIRHALRTLTKRDHPAALELLGYPALPKITVDNLKLPETVRVGEAVDCRFDLTSHAKQKLLVVLRVYFLKANGKLAPKIFTVKKSDFARDERAMLRKKLSFRPMTTRVIYPGRHRIEVFVNGNFQTGADFQLRE